MSAGARDKAGFPAHHWNSYGDVWHCKNCPVRFRPGPGGGDFTNVDPPVWQRGRISCIPSPKVDP